MLGRKVYSGGGVEPDYRMAGPIEGFNPGKFADACTRCSPRTRSGSIVTVDTAIR